ncbi:helix-turn-helix domain-containing protein [Pseudomonas sp.]|jgi:transposase-like protein|uniref:helix-turn-helix domain-containing protein n=1 Tax=Pseudomonas sp. TaxID=306 RepID=UPI0037C6A3C6
MRLTIEQLRQAVRHACNPSLTHRAVARLVGISPNTVRGLRDRLSQRGEGWEQLRDLAACRT